MLDVEGGIDPHHPIRRDARNESCGGDALSGAVSHMANSGPSVDPSLSGAKLGGNTDCA